MNGRSGTKGFVLMEVCVALLLLAVCLLPIIGLAVSLSGRTARLDSRAMSLSQDGGASAVAGADDWTWGPRPGIVTWTQEPRLHVDLCSWGTRGAELVGVWVDGWFKGEWSTQSARELTVGAVAEWQAASGCEVTVRARRRDGAWGAPFRTIVAASAEGAGRIGSPASEPDPTAPASVVVHLPSAAPATLIVTSNGNQGEPVTAFMPQSFLVEDPGPVHATYDGAMQSWDDASSRSVDVYF